MRVAENVEAKIEKMAEMYGQKVEEFKKNLREDDKKYMMQEAKVQKLVDYLLENATIKEVAAEKTAKAKKAPAKKTATKKATKEVAEDGEEVKEKKPRARKTTKKEEE